MNKTRHIEYLLNMYIILIYMYNKGFQFTETNKTNHYSLLYLRWGNGQLERGNGSRQETEAVRVSCSVLCPEGSTEAFFAWWQDLVSYLLQELEPRSAPSVKSNCTRTTMMTPLITMWHSCSWALPSTSLTMFNLSALLMMWPMSSSSTSVTVSSVDGGASITKVGIKTPWFCSVMTTFHIEVGKTLTLFSNTHVTILFSMPCQQKVYNRILYYPVNIMSKAVCLK